MILFRRDVVIADEEKYIWAKSYMRTAGYEEFFTINTEVVKNPLVTGRASL